LGEEVETQMTGEHETTMTEIQSWDEVPVFRTEEEEAAYWETHALGEALLFDSGDEGADPRLPPPRGRKYHRAEMISLRLDPHLLRGLKQLAAERGIGYQTMLKQWLAERLEAEQASARGGSNDPRATARRAPAGKVTDG
jgi:hypothetical protein